MAGGALFLARWESGKPVPALTRRAAPWQVEPSYKFRHLINHESIMVESPRGFSAQAPVTEALPRQSGLAKERLCRDFYPRLAQPTSLLRGSLLFCAYEIPFFCQAYG